MLGLRHTLRARPSFLDIISKKRTHQLSRSDSTGDSLEEEEEQTSPLPTAQPATPQGPSSPEAAIQAQEPSTMAAVSLRPTSHRPTDRQTDLVVCLCFRILREHGWKLGKSNMVRYLDGMLFAEPHSNLSNIQVRLHLLSIRVCSNRLWSPVPQLIQKVLLSSPRT